MRCLILSAFLLVFSGCHLKGAPLSKETGSGADDTEDDSSDDTGKDDPNCNVNDLMLRAGVAGPSGSCILCPPGPLTLVGEVQNPCATDLVFTSRADCLVMQWRVTNEKTTIEENGACPTGLTDHLVPARGSITDTFDLSYLGSGEYYLGETFADPGLTTVLASFTVR